MHLKTELMQREPGSREVCIFIEIVSHHPQQKVWYPAAMQRVPNRFNSLEERRSILGSVSVSVSDNFKLGFDTRSEFPIHLLEGHWTGLWVQWGNLLETHLVVPSLMQEKSLQTETGGKANKARSQYSWQ